MMDDIDRTFDWWRGALTGIRGPIDADNPKAGFYRSKRKDKSLHAVAIWYDSNDGSLRYQEDGRDVEDMRARERWPHDSRRPISEETFWHFREHGVWKDVDAAAQAAEIEAEEAATPEGKAAKAIAAAKKSAEKYAKVESDEAMALAQSLRAKLQELAGAADKAREAEKAPHWEKCKEVDGKWNPMIKDARAVAEGIRKSMEAWNDFKLQQQAAADKAAAAAAETSQADAPSPVASNAPPPSVQVSGGGGRAAHVGVKTVVTEINIDLVFKQFYQDPALRVFLTEMAQKAIDAGIKVPGATTEQRSAIR